MACNEVIPALVRLGGPVTPNAPIDGAVETIPLSKALNIIRRLTLPDEYGKIVEELRLGK